MEDFFRKMLGTVITDVANVSVLEHKNSANEERQRSKSHNEGQPTKRPTSKLDGEDVEDGEELEDGEEYESETNEQDLSPPAKK